VKSDGRSQVCVLCGGTGRRQVSLTLRERITGLGHQGKKHTWRRVAEMPWPFEAAVTDVEIQGRRVTWFYD
jgi:hypothetical protein